MQNPTSKPSTAPQTTKKHKRKALQDPISKPFLSNPESPVEFRATGLLYNSEHLCSCAGLLKRQALPAPREKTHGFIYFYLLLICLCGSSVYLKFIRGQGTGLRAQLDDLFRVNSSSTGHQNMFESLYRNLWQAASSFSITVY